MPSIWSDPNAFGPAKASGDVSWGDYLSATVNVGGADVLAAVPATTRYAAEALLPKGDFSNMVQEGSKYFQNCAE